MKPNYKKMARKYRSLFDTCQETIRDLNSALRYAQESNRLKTETIEKQQQQLEELRVKYAELIAENIRLLEALKGEGI